MEPPPGDLRDQDVRRMAMKAHLEARQLSDLGKDLARRILPSEGPFSAGERVFFWSKDHSEDQGARSLVSRKGYFSDWTDGAYSDHQCCGPD